MPEDERWLKSTITDLDNLLQEISGHIHLACGTGTIQGEAANHLQSCMSSIGRASGTVQSLLAHLEGSLKKETPALVPVPPQTGQPHSPTATGLKSQNVEMVNEVTVTNPTGKKEMIMMVDDEVHVMLLAKIMLAENDYRVVTAKDGFEAIANYKKLGRQIDLIILDFTMPGMHGDQVFEELRKINPSVAVIVSSGFADQTKLNRMFAQGLKEFVAKPYTQQRLLNEVRKVLALL